MEYKFNLILVFQENLRICNERNILVQPHWIWLLTELITIIQMCLKCTYTEVHMGKSVSDALPILNVLKQAVCSFFPILL